ncbi:hypothetical protein SAMN03080599_01090 [Acidaminobacter hydrogenoformans DSM 2784]|uniref:Uncharacterized protein n=1 Tax=Acidaminobacter hydrogenoformans DSM 2784 TaxID=1120920 RepID=A0A1G5RXE7_9FIRM|nr:hypothetical protein SAMN03080599_01090 [Acidaminobacter hydrogenoformans DSM 2784]
MSEINEGAHDQIAGWAGVDLRTFLFCLLVGDRDTWRGTGTRGWGLGRVGHLINQCDLDHGLFCATKAVGGDHDGNFAVPALAGEDGHLAHVHNLNVL